MKSEVEFAGNRVPQSDESGLLSHGFLNYSNGEETPLLSANWGDGSNRNASSVHVYQPDQTERGNVNYVMIKYELSMLPRQEL